LAAIQIQMEENLNRQTSLEMCNDNLQSNLTILMNQVSSIPFLDPKLSTVEDTILQPPHVSFLPLNSANHHASPQIAQSQSQY